MLRPIFITLLASAIPFTLAQASDSHDAHANDHSVVIQPAIAQDAGIRVAIAESGPIEHHLQVYGRLVTPPTHQAQIRARFPGRSEEHTSELQSRGHLVCRLLLEKKKEF